MRVQHQNAFIHPPIAHEFDEEPVARCTGAESTSDSVERRVVFADPPPTAKTRLSIAEAVSMTQACSCICYEVYLGVPSGVEEFKSG